MISYQPYEAFVDEYVKFMQNCANSDNVLDMMTQYAEIMGRYADFAKAIDEYDNLQNEMSTAELAYYEINGKRREPMFGLKKWEAVKAARLARKPASIPEKHYDWEKELEWKPTNSAA